MRLIAFPQWDKLMSLLRNMARQSAAEYAQRKIVRIIPKNGVAHLVNNTVNLLAVEGNVPESEAWREGSSESQNGEAGLKAPRTTTVVMPDMVPGKAKATAAENVWALGCLMVASAYFHRCTPKTIDRCTPKAFSGVHVSASQVYT